MNKDINILKYVRSIKFGLFLIIILIILFLIGSIIPQNQTDSFYNDKYQPLCSNIILILGINNLYQSFIFIFIISLFFVNLLSCLIYRMYKNIRIKKNDFGPDFIHLGLLIIISGGMVSVFTRSEDLIYVSEGDSVEVFKDVTMNINKIEKSIYSDGSPRKYNTSVTVTEKNRNEKKNIKVNSPITIRGIAVYQTTYLVDAIASFQEMNNKIISVKQNEYFKTDAAIYEFFDYKNIRDDEVRYSVIYLKKYINNEYVDTITLREFDNIENFKFISISEKKYVGLKFVRDCGDIFIFIGILLVTIGLILTYTKKIMENRL